MDLPAKLIRELVPRGSTLILNQQQYSLLKNGIYIESQARIYSFIPSAGAVDNSTNRAINYR